MIDYFYEDFLKKLRERQATLSLSLSSNSLSNFEEYRFICGQIQGLKAAEVALKELYEKETKKS